MLSERRGGAPVPGAGVRDGHGVMFVSHAGEIMPSGFMPLSAGNVRHDDIVAVYRDSRLFRALRDPDHFGGRCGTCDFRHPCGGSRARVFAASGDPCAEDPLCPSPVLSRREIDVLRLMMEGLNTRAAAERLHVSHSTIRNHVQNMFAKLGVHNRLEAVAYAARYRLL